MAQDLSQQLQLEQAINKTIEERNALLKEQTKLLSEQARVAQSLVASAQRTNQAGTQTGQNMTTAMQNASEATEETAEEMDKLADEIEKAHDQTGILSKALDTMRGALGGVISGIGSLASGAFSLAKGAFSSLINISGGVIKSIFGIASSILSFPFKLFGFFFDEAFRGGGGGNPLREALEEVREAFGDLSSGPGKAVVDTFKNVRKSYSSLAGTTLSVRKVFGYGRGGIAALLKDINEQAVALGDNFFKLQGVFERMAAKTIIFQRGLGVTKEEMGELMAIASTQGRDVEQYLTEFSKTAILTGKRFGIGVKDMARGMKELTQDVENFGHLGPEAFASITVYARKLGLEIKNMSGIMQKFSGFSDTAEAASKMSQAFGINVDAMQLMAAQNPAEKIDILRKSFFATGKDLNNFNYQQRQYLSQLTGLEGKSLDAAFALENQGINYAQIAKEAKEAGKQQMTQKQVLQELTKGIKRLIQTMSGAAPKNFFDAFLKGFSRGVRRSKPFMKVMKNIRKGAKTLKKAGIEVGRSFVEMFPGVKKFLKGFAEFLEPKKFQRFVKAIKRAFKAFFDSGGDFRKLFDGIKDSLGKEFGPGSSGINNMIDGFQEFAKAAVKVIATFIGTILDELVTPAVKAVGKFFDEIEGDVNKADGIGGKIMVVISALGQKIDEALGASKIGAAFLRIFEPLIKLFSFEGKDNPFKNVANAFKEAFGEGSGFMSVFSDIGKAIAEGAMSILKDPKNEGLRQTTANVQRIAEKGWWTGTMDIIEGKTATSYDAIAGSLQQLADLDTRTAESLKAAGIDVDKLNKQSKMSFDQLGANLIRNREQLDKFVAFLKKQGVDEDQIKELYEEIDDAVTEDIGGVFSLTPRWLTPGFAERDQFLGGLTVGKVLKGLTGTERGVAKEAIEAYANMLILQATGYASIEEFEKATEDKRKEVQESLNAGMTGGFQAAPGKSYLDAPPKKSPKEIEDAYIAEYQQTMASIGSPAELEKNAKEALKTAAEKDKKKKQDLYSKIRSAQEIIGLSERLKELKKSTKNLNVDKLAQEAETVFTKVAGAIENIGTKLGKIKIDPNAKANLTAAENAFNFLSKFSANLKGINNAMASIKKDMRSIIKNSKYFEKRGKGEAAKSAFEKDVDKITSAFPTGSGPTTPIGKFGVAAKKFTDGFSDSNFPTSDDLDSTKLKLESFTLAVGALSGANKVLESFVTASEDIKEKLASEPVTTAMAKLNALNAAAKGSSIVVEHNLNGTPIHMNINLSVDGHSIGKTVLKAKYKTKGGPDKYPAVNEGAAQI